LSKLWVRNVIGAVAALVAIAVVTFTGLRESWATYRHTVVPGAVVPKGQSGEADGYTWKIDATKYLNRSPRSYGPALPAGTVLRVVPSSGPGRPRRKWSAAVSSPTGSVDGKSQGVGGFTAPEGDGVTSLCSGTGLLQFTFLLPQDAVPTAMDIVQFNGRITVRLLL